MHCLRDRHAVDVPTEYGCCRRLTAGERYGVTLIMVVPGAEIPEHMHLHREEMYNVATGAGIVSIDGVEQSLAPGVLFNVAPGEMYSIKNDGKIPLIVIETRVGEYIQDDDILHMPADAEEDPFEAFQQPNVLDQMLMDAPIPLDEIWVADVHEVRLPPAGTGDPPESPAPSTCAGCGRCRS